MNIKKTVILVMSIAIVGSAAFAYTHGWVAYMDGLQEVPPVATPATGLGYGDLSADCDTFYYTASWSNLIGSYTNSHIHVGPVGVGGGVVHPLQNAGPTGAFGAWNLTPAQVSQLYNDSLYFNVHSSFRPGGEIRGQIYCSPDSAVFDADTDAGESQCIQLCEDFDSYIIIDHIPAGFYPVVTKRFGCLSATNPCQVNCYPTDYIQEFFGGEWWPENGDWHWHYGEGRFWLIVRGNGCICVTFDRLLAVELSSFDAIPGDRQVTLNWSTASETNNDYFEVVRDGVPVTVVSSYGNSNSGHDYSWTDRELVNGQTYSYTLFAVDVSGQRAELGTESATPYTQGVIADYQLHQNFPNPFNPSTQIQIDLVEGGPVALDVYDVTGRLVAGILNQNLPRGRHLVSFQADNLAAGLYVYRLTVNGFTDQKKMLFLR